MKLNSGLHDYAWRTGTIGKILVSDVMSSHSLLLSVGSKMETAITFVGIGAFFLDQTPQAPATAHRAGTLR